jgi:NAD-dependent deacetylase
MRGSDHAPFVFVLTGAGVSAESGLGTFRDRDGLWARYDLMEVATPEGFAKDPARVHAFYDARRRGLVEAQPNAAHAALARLEGGLAERGGRLWLCTQNIDDLHERGGSAEVVHMHGELFKARCLACSAVSEWRGDMGLEAACPACGRTGRLRPHVVWFGEAPLHMEAIHEALTGADLFVSIGTSGSVYPAAGFVAEARAAGVRTCEINLEPSDNAWMFDERRYGPATSAVPAWVDALLGAA